MRNPRSSNNVSAIQRLLDALFADWSLELVITDPRGSPPAMVAVFRNEGKPNLQKRNLEPQGWDRRPEQRGRVEPAYWVAMGLIKPLSGVCQTSWPRRISLTSTRLASKASRSTGMQLSGSAEPHIKMSSAA